MFEKEFALLSLFEKAKKIEGRKKLQKVIYLLKLNNIQFEMEFKYHHYGPYSAGLQSEINYLVMHDLLNESNVGEMYSYEITNKGHEFLKSYRQMNADNFYIPDLLLEELLNSNTPLLEMASTYAFLLEMGYEEDEAEKKATELKGHLTYCLDDAKNLATSIMPVGN